MPAAVGITLSGQVSFDGQSLFEGLTLSLPAGKWTCLLGASGVGKSTLLKLLAGLDIGGEFYGRIDTSDHQSLSGRVAYMAQSDLLYPWLNVKQNIQLGNRLRGTLVGEQRAQALIEQVELKKHINKKPWQLSGGMRQRVALARTLMEDTPVVLLDEPFSALDARTRASMQEMAFSALQGKTVLLVSHDPAEAARLAHQLYLMSESGATSFALDETPPIRAIDHPATLRAQAQLLLNLRRCPHHV
jgi:putative hydroxymethylpyrimidine transport system ATP-binding protein